MTERLKPIDTLIRAVTPGDIVLVNKRGDGAGKECQVIDVNPSVPSITIDCSGTRNTVNDSFLRTHSVSKKP